MQFIAFDEIYEEIKCVANLLKYINEKMPRICYNWKIHQNGPFKTLNNFIIRTIFIPRLDDLLPSLNERFLLH